MQTKMKSSPEALLEEFSKNDVKDYKNSQEDISVCNVLFRAVVYVFQEF